MFDKTPCICIPILSNDKFHPSETNVLGLYLYFQENGDFKIINFSHPDVIPSDIKLSQVKLHPKSLVFNKKAMVYNGMLDGIDLNSYLQYYVDETVSLVDFYTKPFDHYYAKFYKSDDVGSIIPMSKHIEFAENIILYVISYYKPDKISDQCIKFSDDFLSVLHDVEKNDVMVDGVPYKQNYVWYTTTTRPSNAWNNFNFTAVNKRDGSREKITSKFEGGKLVQFDYDAFHIKLLAKILNYTFDKHPYEQIKEELGIDVSYNEFKSLIFKNIYGGITDTFIHHPLFLQIQATIDELWDEYSKKGFIESYFYGKRFREIQDPNPNKVFNYFLQSLETEYNIKKMQLVSEIMKGKKSLFSMYIYDAFIFDIHPDENDLISELKKVFETDNMTIKISIGDNFNGITSH